MLSINVIFHQHTDVQNRVSATMFEYALEIIHVHTYVVFKLRHSLHIRTFEFASHNLQKAKTFKNRIVLSTDLRVYTNNVNDISYST